MMKKLGSESNDNLNYKVYLEERKSLVEAEFEGSRLFDKAILALASGAFGLSLTFIRQIVPNIKSGTIFMLICAWIGFCISLLSTLISFLTSQLACSKQRKILETEYFKNHSSHDKKATLKNKASVCTYWLNILSIIAFMFGVIFLASFSIFNLLP